MDKQFDINDNIDECLKRQIEAHDDKMLNNILCIVLDHVTFRHYKMTKGAKPDLNTYEKLASEGMEFTNCHSVHPLCLPARASMMTGMYTHHHGKLTNSKYPDAGYPFFSEYLSKAGYRTGYFGKNHSGFQNLSSKGFEGFYPAGYGNPYKTAKYKEYLEKNGLSNPVYHQEWGVSNDYTNGDYDLTEVNNFNTYSAGILNTPGPVHEADFLVSQALDWIDNCSKEKARFALRLDFWGPHQAFQVPLEFKDKINADEIEEYPSFQDMMLHKPKYSQDFLEKINRRNPIKTWKEWQHVMKRAYENYTYIDSAIGKMLDKLEQDGIAENTIVILTADHGDSLGSHGGMIDKAGDMMEELMHIPMVIRWPGSTCGKASDALVSNLDIVPTILEAAGIEPPAYMDGISMVPFLKGDPANRREDFMAQHYGHFDNHAVQRALYYKNYKYVANDVDIHELYDLEEDPFELHNLINEPSIKNISTEMRKRLLDNMDRYGDTGEGVFALRASINKDIWK